MGNYVSTISCSLINPKMKSPKAARVIFPSGEIRQFREPVKAAELMLECPNFFLVNSRSLNMNRRFSPLSADEDVEFGNVYIMFPMRRVNSMITAADMTVFWMAANTAPKRISGSSNGKVLPEAEGSGEEALKGDNSSEKEEERPRLGVEVLEFGYRLAVCRSRKPFLDTITEEPILSR